MNERFVNIKVDREERPDVDAVYMDAVQAMTGRGGWPMTVFLTPDGRPFFGGTYFPKANFLQLLEAVDDAWRTKRDDLLSQADQLTDVAEPLRRAEAGRRRARRRAPQRRPAAAGQGVRPTWGGFGARAEVPADR